MVGGVGCRRGFRIGGGGVCDSLELGGVVAAIRSIGCNPENLEMYTSHMCIISHMRARTSASSRWRFMLLGSRKF